MARRHDDQFPSHPRPTPVPPTGPVASGASSAREGMDAKGKLRSQKKGLAVSEGNVSSRIAPTDPDGHVLTAITFADGTCQVTVADHYRKFSFGTVYYNGGSAWLLPDTIYEVWAEDPEMVGGLVAYGITTDPDALLDSPGRMWVGNVYTPAVPPVGVPESAPQAGEGGGTNGYQKPRPPTEDA